MIGTALAFGGALPRLSLLVVAPCVMRDWPPFMSYLFTLALAIGLLLRYRLSQFGKPKHT